MEAVPTKAQILQAIKDFLSEEDSFQTQAEPALQATEIAACNWLHEVEEPLARWLLMSADRVGSSSLGLTQEVIGQMLGTRRSSVTVAAGILQKAGLIAYTRGDVKIVQRAKLEQAACECYRLMQQQTEVWKSQFD